MAGVLVSGLRQYTSAIKKYPYNFSVFAQALADTSKFRFSKFGEYTMVREIVGISTGEYDGDLGFKANSIAMDTWAEFKAEYDREISFGVDAVKELNTIMSGMTLTGLEILKASWRKLGPEIDAVSSASIYNSIPDANKHANTATGWETTSDKIIENLINIVNGIYELGWYGDICGMLSSTVYARLSAAFVEKNGLASGAMLRDVTLRDESRTIGFPGSDYYEDGLSFKYSVKRFGEQLYLYNVPKASMISDVILLDGKSSGQESGGWLPNVDATGFHYLDALFVPTDAAALSVRHIVANMTIPSTAYAIEQFDINDELLGLNKMYEGQVYLDNIGIDQTGDRFKYMNRILYGLAVFNTQAHLIQAIYDASTPGTPTVTSVVPSATEVGGEGDNSVIVTTSGTDLSSVVVALFNGETKVGETFSTTGNLTTKVALVNVPVNNTESQITLTVKVSTDNGITWDAKTATIAVNPF